MMQREECGYINIILLPIIYCGKNPLMITIMRHIVYLYEE